MDVLIEPGVLHQLRGAHPLLDVLDQQLGDKVLSVPRDVSPSFKKTFVIFIGVNE